MIGFNLVNGVFFIRWIFLLRYCMLGGMGWLLLNMGCRFSKSNCILLCSFLIVGVLGLNCCLSNVLDMLVKILNFLYKCIFVIMFVFVLLKLLC